MWFALILAISTVNQGYVMPIPHRALFATGHECEQMLSKKKRGILNDVAQAIEYRPSPQMRFLRQGYVLEYSCKFNPLLDASEAEFVA